MLLQQLTGILFSTNLFRPLYGDRASTKNLILLLVLLLQPIQYRIVQGALTTSLKKNKIKMAYLVMELWCLLFPCLTNIPPRWVCVCAADQKPTRAHPSLTMPRYHPYKGKNFKLSLRMYLALPPQPPCFKQRTSGKIQSTAYRAYMNTIEIQTEKTNTLKLTRTLMV